MLIGMLHYRKNPQSVKKAYPFAAVAKMEDMSFVYFSFDGVDFEHRCVNGWVYEDREWKQRQMDIPTVIINSCNPKNKKQSEILESLRKKAILTSHSVGNKLKVYKKVLKAGSYADYLIPSTVITSPEEIFVFLKNGIKAVMKPIKGNHGKRVFFLERDENIYKVTDDTNVYFLNKTQLCDFIDRQIREQEFLLQPYIHCKTKAGLPYDFRLHVQKNGAGKWEITLIYPRISGSEKLISNISSGGYRGELEPFLAVEFDDNAEKIKTNLEQFALNFPIHFETLYNHPFDELGLDVGIDEKERLWLYEVNWRPGCKHREFDVAKRLIPYCYYLSEQIRLST